MFDETITFEEWATVGKQALRAAEALQWVLGDWCNYGYVRFVSALYDAPAKKVNRARYDVALQSLPYEYQTLRNIAWIADSVPMSRRRDKLKFSHHAEVAGLSAEDQEKYLTVAEKDGLSVAELRALIRSDRAEVKEQHVDVPDQSITRYLTPARMLLFREPPESLSPEVRAQRKRDLQPFVDYYQRL